MLVNVSVYAGIGWQFFDNNGDPLTGGKLYTYYAGTTTPQPTYTSDTGTTAHTNPIILDAAGRVPGGQVWSLAGSSYKFVLKTSNDTLIATYDNVLGSGTRTEYINTFTGDGATTVFALVTAPNSKNDTNVYIGGVYQQKATFSLTGSALLFSEAPPINASIEVVYF